MLALYVNSIHPFVAMHDVCHRRCLARAPLLSTQVLCRLSFYVRWLLEHVSFEI